MYLAEIDDNVLTSILGVEPCCPQCRADLSGKVQASLLAGKRVQCVQCGFYGTWRFGTELHAARISNSQFLCMLFGFAMFPDPTAADKSRIAKTLDLDIHTVNSWHHKITTAMGAK